MMLQGATSKRRSKREVNTECKRGGGTEERKIKEIMKRRVIWRQTMWIQRKGGGDYIFDTEKNYC